jgi:outer membrane beta-barrel protein
LAGRLELSLSGLAQVNGAFTDHLGVGLEAVWHLDEDLALYAGGTLYPMARESGFADQLLASASLVPGAPGELLVRWAAGAGVELAPVHGKFTWGEEGLTRFVLFVRAGGGVASTRIWLAPSAAERGPLLGDAGLRLVGTAALGVRVGLTERLGLRAEVRADVFSARIQKVDGCGADDLSALAASGSSARVASGCDAAAFARDGYAGVRAAQAAVESPSSGLAAHVALQLGVGYLF